MVLFAVLLSWLWWMGDVRLQPSEYCPDGYCTYLERIHWALTGTDAGSRIQLLEFVNGYTHAHSPLAPLVGGVAQIAFQDSVVSFAVVSIGAMLLAWLSLARTFASDGDTSRANGSLLFAAFFGNPIVIRSIARPNTDAVGLVCTVWALVALDAFLRHRSQRRGALLGLAMFVGMSSRVSFIPMLGLPALAEVFGGGQSKQAVVGRAARSALLFGLVPGLLFLGVTTAVGMQHLRAAWQTAHLPEFTSEHTVRFFLRGIIIAGGPYVLLYFLGGPHARTGRQSTIVHSCWIVLYLAFLGLGRGALWPRYFLPIVPSILVVGAAGLAELAERHRAVAWWLVGLTSGVGFVWGGGKRALWALLS